MGRMFSVSSSLLGAAAAAGFIVDLADWNPFQGGRRARVGFVFNAHHHQEHPGSLYPQGVCAGVCFFNAQSPFDRQFYLDLVNIEEHLKANPLKTGGFNHYRPARYFAEGIATLAAKLDKPTLSRFEAAFEALNGLL
jgi:hypothetical protein